MITTKEIKYSPMVTNAEFASLVGVSQGVVDGWVKRDYVPTVKMGKYRLINIALLNHHLLYNCNPRGKQLDAVNQKEKDLKESELRFDSLPRTERRRFLKQAKNEKSLAVELFLMANK